MSITDIVFGWLNERLAAGALLPRQGQTVAEGNTLGARRYAVRRHEVSREALQWRGPWFARQALCWVSGTLLAPTVWMVGILLAINSHSDQPVFWPSMMAVVAIANAVAIIQVNQCHHRRPYTSHLQLALHYFAIGVLVGSALFVPLFVGTGALQAFARFSSDAADAASPARTLLWTAVITASFALLSFVHASALHAWIAFEAPDTRRA